VAGQRLDLPQEVLGGEAALPSEPGSVLDVAATRTPASTSLPSRVDTSTVSPGSSSSNSSIDSSRWLLSACTVGAKPSAPTRWVSSTNVPYALGSGAACHSEASRWVLPTP
jgi:hypothetical protein